MGRPVVAASACTGAIEAEHGRDLLAATTAEDYVIAINSLLTDIQRASEIGANGRQCVLSRYSWEAHLSGIDRYLPADRSAGMTHSSIWRNSLVALLLAVVLIGGVLLANAGWHGRISGSDPAPFTHAFLVPPISLWLIWRLRTGHWLLLFLHLRLWLALPLVPGQVCCGCSLSWSLLMS